ncbi:MULTISPECIES: hypothetical protein [unclassified Microcoleus]|uniref:hypothetical protein n=1 Tax=unclassified Microcoleus TaxID=2642155 RepID=UPI001D88E334|nr:MULTISPECIES: hypothetical protein [unclassified Microcoleus]MCC3442600.1 hypothetical protein [Microcoleus sp. PH2017_03_ELD_O_A]MCC3469782.1 hypothetical protein [Microcoleus sp. PH2017_06_SFM_O_A]MCC3506255.1 hypothetical protein [Microcoleus sp. PH2017_19_SFW_U_A]MCC3511897.1 hypothetical protein [Microcoleus sp. PH2017_17_BER_D_A]MCC3523261.1 hypothetical protein [Microcoleus sp. PH2017_20_SFW_D_A]MCC3545209.1 hypothetical protein [Microcoleus sp. PH2017_24_DOB_U_A]MCC3553949.1 hypot
MNSVILISPGRAGFQPILSGNIVPAVTSAMKLVCMEDSHSSLKTGSRLFYRKIRGINSTGLTQKEWVSEGKCISAVEDI